jgi:hypothetical protein
MEENLARESWKKMEEIGPNSPDKSAKEPETPAGQ